MIRSGHATGRKILLLDHDAKRSNDRTWCFWETKPGLFEDIVYKSWQSLLFRAPGVTRSLSIEPYTYKLIRGVDFYRYCFELIDREPGMEFRQARITACHNREDGAEVALDDGTLLTAGLVFNSLYSLPSPDTRDIRLLQHFRGWLIETDTDAFNPEQATLMDFRTGQDAGATFFYVMPFSERQALVEYTLFSPALLDEKDYHGALETYIGSILGVGQYRILEKEAGAIPMTNHRFPRGSGRIRNIGTAGGQTKSSSGYTFRFIQKEVAAIVKSLEGSGHPFPPRQHGKRFTFYDNVLLSVLNQRRMPGHALFSRLFEKNRPQDIMRFLDNESSLTGELKIIATLPTMPFLRAAAWTVASS
ncbi:MAG: hypothetical protein JWP27_452 [Flaviaesturariibacter sp.]|nr:hypothetical protein [Flaviaesturariibacter sp.]